MEFCIHNKMYLRTKSHNNTAFNSDAFKIQREIFGVNVEASDSVLGGKSC